MEDQQEQSPPVPVLKTRLRPRTQRRQPRWLIDYAVYTPSSQVAPALVHEPPEVVISALCRERDELLEKLAVQEELLDTTSSNLDAANEAVRRHIGTSILMAIKPTYSSTPIDIRVGCSVEFYDTFTEGWTTYIPQRRRCDYETYRLCTDIDLFQSQLPGWDLTRSTSLIAQDALTYRLMASAEHPIYAIYSAGCATMGLSFFYLPDPLPPLFIPRYNKGTPFRRLLFYQEHNTNSRKRKHTEQAMVKCERDLPSFLSFFYTMLTSIIRASNTSGEEEADK